MSAVEGGCHCGNIRWRFTPSRPFAELAVRRCTCRFCTKHGAYYTSDPAGQLAIAIRDPDLVSVYRFASGVADPQVCRRCGVMPVILTRIGERLHAVVNLASAENIQIAPERVQPVSFDNESIEEGIARRARTWIGHVTLHIGPESASA